MAYGSSKVSHHNPTRKPKEEKLTPLQKRIREAGFTPPPPTVFVDPTTPRPGSDYELAIYYVPLDRKVAFKAFITEFSDEFTSNWETEEVYGRMDPVQTFKSTTRSINVGFDVVAASFAEAEHNMGKISELASMHYPTYKTHNKELKAGSAAAINQSPLLRVKYANWITRADTNLGAVKETGLLCASTGFSFAPQMDDLMFASTDGSKFYPKLIKISLTLNVIHEHGLGFQRAEEGSVEHDKNKRVHSFPYHATYLPDQHETIPAPPEKNQSLPEDAEKRDPPVGMSSPEAPMSVENTEAERVSREEELGMSLPD